MGGGASPIPSVKNHLEVAHDTDEVHFEMKEYQVYRFHDDGRCEYQEVFDTANEAAAYIRHRRERNPSHQFQTYEREV